MPFGPRNAPTSFQWTPDLIISSGRFRTYLFYLDDVLIFLKLVEDLIKHVDEVLQILQDAGIYRKLRKCYLFRKAVQ